MSDVSNAELTELLQLMRHDPKAVARLFTDNPDLARKVIEQDEVYKIGEVPSVDSFAKIYEAFFDRPLPSIDLQVAEEFVWALKERKGVVYEKWRGGGKSTFFAAWCPSVIGWRPVGSTTLMRVNDQKAKEMGKIISQLIESNIGWKKYFPHVLPDEKKGWSVENGFNVLDTRITGAVGSPNFEEGYAKWNMLCLADHLSEQSLLCLGIGSGSGIGLHPTNGMWFDDLHDENNTRSQAEMKTAVETIKGNVIASWYGVGGSPTLGVFCTPWSENPPDVYQVMLKTGLFKHIKMPIMKEDENGEVMPTVVETADGERSVDPEYAGKKFIPTQPDFFPIKRIAQMIITYGTRFGQMGMLDISKSRPKNMRYQEFPSDNIKWKDWPLVAGVDPVGTVKGINTGTGVSSFAMGYFLKTPYNTLVVGDGVIEKCDASEGERLLMKAQKDYRTFQRASIESNGVGALFISLLTRNKGLRVSPHNTNEIGKGSKETRQYEFLQPLFANGTVLVSDAKTPYLDGVREYLENFPNIDRASPLWDIGDSLVLGIFDCPEVWTKVTVNSDDEFWAKKKVKADPYAKLLEGLR